MEANGFVELKELDMTTQLSLTCSSQDLGTIHPRMETSQPRRKTSF
jgi:hypothetical protein